MEEVISSSLEGFVFEKDLNSWRSESKYESLGKSFYSLSFNFQKFRIHSLSDNQSTINQIYLFIITFQNLEFWDVTNLPPLKRISSSRFGEASKKKDRVWGSPQNSSIVAGGVWGATTLRSMVTVPSKLIYSILILDRAGLLRS